MSTQAFYAERAFRLMNRNYYLLAAIIVGMCCQFSASVAVAVITATTPGFEQVEVSDSRRRTCRRSSLTHLNSLNIRQPRSSSTFGSVLASSCILDLHV